MNLTQFYEAETELQELSIDVPAWIEGDIDTAQVAAIIEGGCESGAYMPAVTYWQALETMSKHGDEVLQCLDDHGFEMSPPENQSWGGIAVHYLSTAVDLWASGIEEELEDALEELTKDAE